MKTKIKKILKRKSVKICLVALLTLLLILITVLITSKYGYEQTNIKEINLYPNIEHFFGTDSLGRDLWARVWFGMLVSMLIGVLGSLIPHLFGFLIGSISGYYGGKIDLIIMGIVDIGTCIPSLIYTTLIMIYFGPGIVQLIFAISMSSWMNAARLVRSRVIQFKNKDFVLYYKIQGVSSLRIIFRHIFPNILGQLITEIFSAIPVTMFTEAYLSFVGLGIGSPMVSLGQLCKIGINNYRLYPYQFFIPAVMIFLLVLLFYVLSNNIREIFDVKAAD